MFLDKRLRLLVVGRDVDGDGELERLLTRLGHKVLDREPEAPIALTLIDREEPDVIVADGRADDGEEPTRGLELALRDIKLIQDRCPSPILLIIDHHLENPLQQAEEAGAGAVLPFPAAEEDLQTALTVAYYRFRDFFSIERLLCERKELSERAEFEAGSRAQAMEAYRENRDLLSLAIKTARLGVWIHNPMSQSFFSVGLKSILGYDEEAMADHLNSWLSIVHPDDREVVDMTLRQAMQGAASEFRFEHRVLRRDQSVAWVSSSAIIGRNKNGEAIRVAGTTADVTELKETERALRSSTAHYQALFDRTPVAILEEDLSQVGEWLNDLRKSGVEDLQGYFDEHPEALLHASSLIRVNDVNEAYLELVEAESKQQALEALSSLFDEEVAKGLAPQLLAIWEGRDRLETAHSGLTFSGRPFDFVLRWWIPRDGEKLDLTQVIVTFVRASAV